ncbi:hypothetical protein I6E78_12145 [Pseudoalteromonas sp. NZS127]|uniref:hypothetical protein n=1 Tax=Pseudoalteromonas TaxID=53246 RepID=UPI0018CF5767|nr:hypothetical protein [Pseudoalteromonas sp. NZS127]MBH0072720.1 hypothetical protein [Pseudoalteromonas sp. NZS127]
MSYPKIIIYNNEIELAEQPDEVDDFIYAMDELHKSRVIILDSKYSYTTLSGEPKTAISAIELANLVKGYLLKEGQCCLSKIKQLTPEQAFALLIID